MPTGRPRSETPSGRNPRMQDNCAVFWATIRSRKRFERRRIVPGPNARLYADFVRHPRRRTYTLEGETMTRSQARDYARGMLVESARNDARAWGDGYDPDAMAEQAGDWFDRTYPMPKRR